MTRTVRAIIRGRVQGVSFRYWTRGQALHRGLRGWVRNRPDGSVEAVFSGEAPVVQAMLDACRDGPPAAKVEGLEMQPLDPDGLPASFDILYG